MLEKDSTNKNLEIADAFVRYTSTHLFLTGKAGTGKTTFLKRIVATCKKSMMIAAPTGVAAINAGGVTLHSLFQLPMGPFLPIDHAGDSLTNTKHSLYQKLKINSDKRKLINELELLIIDEISMVRADMLDAIDAVLRYVRKESRIPFGGVQVLMIGDLYQLPPVTSDQDWSILSRYYDSPFFFHAKALSNTNFVSIELDKIYRQSDPVFIEMLNGIRNNNITTEQLDQLNSHFNGEMNSSKKDGYITLTTHNQKASDINQNKLNSLQGEKYIYQAVIEGDFQERAYPVDHTIALKKGAQIIFTKNDKEEPRRYYNGKLGVVSDLDSESITVTLPESQEEIIVEVEEWKNIRYQLNEAKNEIEEQELGTFTQYPIKLAWAITIHKSQGLTFERAIVDAQASFSSGQVYVALSRLTGLNGLILRSKIHPGSIRTSHEVINFMQNLPSYDHLLPYLESASGSFLTNQLASAFSFQKLIDTIHDYIDELDSGSAKFKSEALEVAKKWLIRGNELNIIGKKFQTQIFQLTEYKEYQSLEERIEKGKAYFNEQLVTFEENMNAEKKALSAKRGSKKYVKVINSISIALAHDKAALDHSSLIVKGLKDSTTTVEILKNLEDKKVKDKSTIAENMKMVQTAQVARGETKNISLAMFKEGKDIETIATEREMVPGTIQGHLTSFIETGEVLVTDLVSQEKIDAIQAVIAAIKEEKPSSALIKEKLGDEFSYGEIRAVHMYNLLQAKSS